MLLGEPHTLRRTVTLLPDLASSFAHDLGRHGERPAVLDAATGVELSYIDLQHRIDRIADRLRSETRRLVLLEAANSVDHLATYLAARQLDHPVLLAPGGRHAAVRDLVDAYDPDVVVSGPDAAIDERRRAGAHDLHPDLALLLSTSGSTGSAKVVRLSHANLQTNADAIALALGIRSDDRAITSLPMAYCYGLSVVHSHLTRGASLLLSDASVVDEAFWTAFRRHGATTFAGVPHTFELLERIGFDGLDIPSLRYVTQAGGRLAPELVRRYAELGRRRGWDLHVMYGQTEATARMACLPPHLAADRPSSVGRAIPGGSFDLDLDAGDGTGEVGELVYRGPNVMLGYAHGPADLAEGRVVHELRTGDLARVDADGLFEVVGRRHRFVKPFGLRIDLDGVERSLRARGIDALVAGDDRRIVVAATTGDASTHVQDLTGLPAVAVDVHLVGALPRLGNGKPDHAAVLELSQAARPRPQTRTSPVRDLFREVLRVDDVGDDDTFATVGGDSLSYVELSVRLEELLGAVPDDWPARTVGDLERVRGDGTAPGRSPLVRAVDTTIALRAGAVGLIVATHAGLTDLRGGAHLLLAIAGWNFARFQVPASPNRLARSVGRILGPTLTWLAVLLLVTDDYELHNLLLLHSQIGAEPWDERWRYWFVEALVPILVVAGALVCVPAVRRLERRRPFELPAALTLAALAATLPFDGDRIIHRPQTIAWVFALGWTAQRAVTTQQRVAVSLLALAGAQLFFADPERKGVVVVGLLVLLWVRSVPLPTPLHRVAGWIAAASLWTYLVHWQVYPTVVEHLTPAAATVASLVAGIAVHAAWSAVGRRRNTAARRTG